MRLIVTECNRLCGKLIVAQLVSKFPSFYVIRGFFIVYIRDSKKTKEKKLHRRKGGPI
jgi:hypothetical protein